MYDIESQSDLGFRMHLVESAACLKDRERNRHSAGRESLWYRQAMQIEERRKICHLTRHRQYGAPPPPPYWKLWIFTPANLKNKETFEVSLGLENKFLPVVVFLSKLKRSWTLPDIKSVPRLGSISGYCCTCFDIFDFQVFSSTYILFVSKFCAQQKQNIVWISSQHTTAGFYGFYSSFVSYIVVVVHPIRSLYKNYRNVSSSYLTQCFFGFVFALSYGYIFTAA